ncbi:hypothetical protein ASG89_31970 [Paenibacillus sp. Soil766]|uniref:hypothetical protein n=1 Tax=Paenibacillus sp. Soil766 TaxID=1736404 RepID=UPI00070F66B4|nr:hypothetical protein [Paenibacillus sp. Soil766]KRE94910.1 hypothetical protein ASG89_31970 [Paenibacillus sp. Soil766]
MEGYPEVIRAKRPRQIYRSWARIPEKRKEELLLIKYNPTEMSVYCDCSAIKGTRCAGISACFVGYGRVYVQSQKLDKKNVGKSIFSELLAVKFSLDLLPNILDRYRQWNPTRVVIYSDVEAIEDLIYKGTSKKLYMRREIEEIKRLMESFSDLFDVVINYIGEQRSYNIFYNATHTASRKAIGKKRR